MADTMHELAMLTYSPGYHFPDRCIHLNAMGALGRIIEGCVICLVEVFALPVSLKAMKHIDLLLKFVRRLVSMTFCGFPPQNKGFQFFIFDGPREEAVFLSGKKC